MWAESRSLIGVHSRFARVYRKIAFFKYRRIKSRSIVFFFFLVNESGSEDRMGKKIKKLRRKDSIANLKKKEKRKRGNNNEMTNEGANWGGNRRRENEEEISRGMVDRSAQCTQCRGEISITWTRRGWSETKKLENFKFRFNFDAFRRLGNESADCSEMLAETHEINHRRRHWAPFQNRNVTTERAPPSSDDESRTSRIAGFLFSLFRHHSNCIVRDFASWNVKNQPLKRKFVFALNGIILRVRLIDSIEMEI